VCWAVCVYTSDSQNLPHMVTFVCMHKEGRNSTNRYLYMKSQWCS
jgi:hypothetical protein